ncbi:hypothetical protein PSEG_05126 [Pseudomonas sp. Nvir]|jgi:hypothetical protein
MPAVDSSQLEAYIVELSILISLGEDDMANLAAATDRQDAVPEQPLTHRARKQLKPNDFLDVYDIYRLQPRQISPAAQADIACSPGRSSGRRTSTTPPPTPMPGALPKAI